MKIYTLEWGSSGSEWHYKILKDGGNMVFVVPCKKDGSDTTSRMTARFCKWVLKRDLIEKVNT